MQRDYIAEATDEAAQILKSCRIEVYRDNGNCCSKVWLFLDHAEAHIRRKKDFDAEFAKIMEPEAEFELQDKRVNARK